MSGNVCTSDAPAWLNGAEERKSVERDKTEVVRKKIFRGRFRITI